MIDFCVLLTIEFTFSQSCHDGMSRIIALISLKFQMQFCPRPRDADVILYLEQCIQQLILSSHTPIPLFFLLHYMCSQNKKDA